VADVLVYLVALPAIALAIATLLVVRRGLQMKELVRHGVDVEGVVVAKKRSRTSAGHHKQSIRYQYTDSTGRTWRHRSQVPFSVWSLYEEGSSLPVVYSRLTPHVSAPKYLVELARRGERQ
jgi:hypothetical protein